MIRSSQIQFENAHWSTHPQMLEVGLVEVEVRAHRRTGDRAGDHHARALQRERRQVGDVRARQKPCQLSRDAHS
jgi:hypothetical protein